MAINGINFENSEILANANSQVGSDPSNYIQPTIDPSVLALIKKREEMASMPLAPETTNADYFPSGNTPVTQQGISGSYINAPTIAPTGNLIPFAAFDAMNKAAYDRRAAEYEAAEKTKLPEFKQLSDLTNNPQYQAANYAILNKYLEELKVKMKDQGIDMANFGVVANNDQGLKRLVADINDKTEAWNVTYRMASDILTESQTAGTKIYSKETIQTARDIFSGMDAYINEPTQENLARAKEYMLKLQGAVNLDEATDKVAQNVKSDIGQEVSLVGSFTDYDKYIQSETKGAFLKPILDKKNNITGWKLDDDKFNQFASTAYNTYYGNNPLVSYSDFKNNLEAKIESSIKDELKTVSTPSRGRIAEYGAKKKMDEVNLAGHSKPVKVTDASGNPYNFNTTEFNIPPRVQGKTTGTFRVGQIATSNSGAVFRPTQGKVYGTLISWGRTSDSGQPYGVLEDEDGNTVYVVGKEVENTIRDISSQEGYVWNYEGKNDEFSSSNVPTQGSGENINLNEGNGWKKIN